MRLSLSAAVTLLLSIPVFAKLDVGRRGHARVPSAVATDDTHIYNATFDQLIDHNNPSLGTFKQTYWYSLQFWKGSGSPVSIPLHL